MIVLYASQTPNARKVFIMLEECELPYEVVPFNVWKGEQFKLEFKKISPNSKIPTIVDHDGPNGSPYALAESGAILLYLAEKTGKFLPKDVAGRYQAIQWLMIQMASIGPISGQLMHFRRFSPPGQDYSLSRYLTEALRLYDVLEERLSASEYLAGPDYGVADMATFPWIESREPLGITLTDRPNLQRWRDAIAARPATLRAIKRVTALPSNSIHATPDDLDRIFGRGRYARVSH